MATPYPEINPVAMRLLESRYLQDEDVEGMFQRVAHAAASRERERMHWYVRFHDMMRSLRFLPNTPTLVHAGRHEGKRSLSACFVDSPQDNLLDITRIGYEIPHIESAGGGMGWGLSNLRPKGDLVNGRPGACGPLAVLQWYAQAGRTFTQGATRPGAHMAQLDVSHPDIMEFIHAKDNCTSPDDPLANVNISVRIPDAFMTSVAVDDREWKLINPRTNGAVGTLPARDIWRAICESAWRTGDPGIVFQDRIEEPNPQYGRIISSNPCAEQMLEDGGSCNLGSLDLSKYVGTTSRYGHRSFAHNDFIADIHTAVRFLDNIIDINWFPFEKLREVNQGTRRIGLGVMGWADALAELGIPYDSDDALALAHETGRILRREAHLASAYLATEKGELRPGYDYRNSATTTIAPTGSISIIAGCSSGIEPHYALFNTRKALWTTDGKSHEAEVLEMPQVIRRALGDKLPPESMARSDAWVQREYVVHHGGEELLDICRTAMEISPEAHVYMQAAWQEHIDNGVSKTVNLPWNATVDDVEFVYKLAYHAKCKASSIYRDGSKGTQVLSSGDPYCRTGACEV